MNANPAELIRDLRGVGVEVDDIWRLPNSNVQYHAAIPMLMEWLRNLDTRVQAADRPKLREGLVRAISVPWANPMATDLMIEQFRGVDASADPTGMGLRWVIGNALEVLFDDASFDDLAELAKDSRYGKARQMIVLGFGKSKRAEAVDLLLSLVNDADVDGHAVKALGKLKSPEARTALEAKLKDERAWVRGEARRALSRLLS